MSFASIVEHPRIHSASVVANPHLQVLIGILEFAFDSLRPGMAECVEQCLSSNPVDLLLDQRAERLLRSRDSDAKINILPTSKLLLNSCQRLHEIRGARLRRAQSFNSTSALLNPSTHDFKYSI